MLSHESALNDTKSAITASQNIFQWIWVIIESTFTVISSQTMYLFLIGREAFHQWVYTGTTRDVLKGVLAGSRTVAKKQYSLQTPGTCVILLKYWW